MKCPKLLTFQYLPPGGWGTGGQGDGGAGDGGTGHRIIDPHCDRAVPCCFHRDPSSRKQIN